MVYKWASQTQYWLQKLHLNVEKSLKKTVKNSLMVKLSTSYRNKVKSNIRIFYYVVYSNFSYFMFFGFFFLVLYIDILWRIPTPQVKRNCQTNNAIHYYDFQRTHLNIEIDVPEIEDTGKCIDLLRFTAIGSSDLQPSGRLI